MLLWDVSKEYKMANIIMAILIIIFLLLPLASICLEYLGHPSFLVNNFHCFYKIHTGEPCPTCGLTHSILSLYRGHLQESISYHSYGYLFFILLIIQLCLRVVPYIYIRIWIPYVDISQMLFCGLIFKTLISGN